MATYIIIATIAYAIGSINFSVIISKKMAGFDVREKGSGNAGSTNVLRSVGKKAAILTLICDILKGVIAVLIAVIIGKIVKDVDKAVLKGGKGVATSLGVLLIINWKVGLICLVFALVIMALTRIVSLGSIGAAILCPVLTLFIHSNYIVEAN